ncbi:MAG: hypothetical protein KJ064_27250 [Anaerolineae bacterium]|nr:hypothetical protein [Anaerolineae bacterium]
MFVLRYAEELSSQSDPYPNWIRSLDWSPNGNFIATATINGVIQIWDNTGQLIRSLDDHAGITMSLAWNPDGSKLATASDKAVSIWDTNTGNLLQTLEGHQDLIWSISWSPDGFMLIGTAFDLSPNIIIWNTDTGQQIFSTFSGTALSSAWSPDNQYISIGQLNKIQIRDTNTWQVVKDLSTEPNYSYSLDWSPDGTKIASAEGYAPDSDMIRIWNIATEQVILEYRGHSDLINHVTWSPDGTKIASASSDTTIHIWDALTGENLRIIQGNDRLFATDWSPDGTQLAYGDLNGDLVIIPISSDPVCAATQTISAGDLADFINAINTANSNPDADVIGLEAGTYTFTTAHIPLNALPAIISDITICSIEGATLTRQADAPLFGFFEVSAGGSLTLDNLTLNGGDVGNDTGGALVNEGGTVTLNNVTFTNNHANTGGAIDNENGSLTITDSTFENNQADYGGAIDNDTDGTLSISGSTFTSNTAALDGGAIHNDGGTLTVTDSTFTSNTASRYGGALDNLGSATISSSTFSGNSAAWSGGAIRNTNTLTITDSVFSGNSATSSYGSLYLTSSSTTTAHNSCFSGNSATSVGFTGTPMQDFTGNWWGAADGPSGSGPGSGDAVNNRINYASFLTTGCPHP